jgi:hypothetical protein
MFKLSIKQFLKQLISRRRRPAGVFVGRARTRDIAFQYRMGAGFVGDVNRTHPASIEPTLCDPNTPPTAYGQPVVVVPATNAVRPLIATDTALTAIYGITVRPYPQQQTSLTSVATTVPFGPTPPPTNQPIDVLRSGYIMVKVSGSVAVAKGGAVFVWIAASSGSHVQGGFEPVASAGNTIALDAKTTWNGPADSGGIAELSFNA